MRACSILAALLLAPALSAADKEPLKPIDTKEKGVVVVVPKDARPSKPTTISSAEELAKSPLFAKDSGDRLKKEVNFEKEKLVVFAWTGSDRDTLKGKLEFSEKFKVMAVVFECTQSLTTDLREHGYVFVVPNDTLVDVRTIAALEEIPLKGLKVAFPEKPGGPTKPEVIISAAKLAEHPALKDAADEIKKHVDFDKQQLVFVAWRGSSADKFASEVRAVDKKLVVAFVATPGSPTDLQKHTRLFVVPKGVSVESGGH